MQISVVIPVKNAVGTIGRTLDSLSSQTYRDFEVLIVDGGSTDGTVEAIESRGLAEVVLIHDPGSGIPRAVNVGISKARGAIVMPWLCADDYLDSGFLAAMAAVWDREHPDFAYGNWHGVAGGKVIKSRRPERGWEKKLRYAMPTIMSNSFVFKRELFAKMGQLDESIKYACDYEFILRIVGAGYRGAYCGDAWYYYQIGGLSQRRFLDVAREVAVVSRRHGGSTLLAYWNLGKAYLRVNASFIRNRYRAVA